MTTICSHSWISSRSLPELYGSLPFVPFGNFGGRPFLRVISDPSRDFFIGCPGGHEAPERIVLKLGEFQPPLIDRAVGEVVALPPYEGRPAFVQRARSQCISTELLTRAARRFSIAPEITGQQLHLGEVYLHRDSCFPRLVRNRYSRSAAESATAIASISIIASGE